MGSPLLWPFAYAYSPLLRLCELIIFEHVPVPIAFRDIEVRLSIDVVCKARAGKFAEGAKDKGFLPNQHWACLLFMLSAT
eukprot:14866893-Ditylum_brightwellii.AAC.1